MQPYKNADGGCVDPLETANVDSLRVVAEPVAKVGPLDHHRGPFLAVEEEERLEHILNVSMSPIVTFDLGDRRDVSSTERCGLAWQDNQQDSEDEQYAAA